jgi:hypothetical protein
VDIEQEETTLEKASKHRYNPQWLLGPGPTPMPVVAVEKSHDMAQSVTFVHATTSLSFLS